MPAMMERQPEPMTRLEKSSTSCISRTPRLRGGQNSTQRFEPKSEAGLVSFQVHQIERSRSARIGDRATPAKAAVANTELRTERKASRQSVKGPSRQKCQACKTPSLPIQSERAGRSAGLGARQIDN